VDIVCAADGRTGVTKIGNVCGSKLFGDRFEVAVRTAQALHRRQLQKDAIAEGLAAIPTRALEAQGLLDNARHLEKLKLSLRDACTDKLYYALVDRAERGQPEIIITRKRTDNDPPAPDGSHAGFIDERAGTLQGLRCLANPSPRRILEERVLGPLHSFRDATPDEILSRAGMRRRFTNWNQNVESTLREVQDKLAQVSAFFTTENLRLLQALAVSRGLDIDLRRIRWNATNRLVEVG
jgi:hypothetical protein